MSHNIKQKEVLKNEKDLIKFNNQVKNAKKNNEIVACLIEQGALKDLRKI